MALAIFLTGDLLRECAASADRDLRLPQIVGRKTRPLGGHGRALDREAGSTSRCLSGYVHPKLAASRSPTRTTPTTPPPLGGSAGWGGTKFSKRKKEKSNS